MTKLNREMILRGLLQTLVDGYGRKAVESTLAALDGPTEPSERKRPEASQESAPRGAEAMVVALEAPPEKKRSWSSWPGASTRRPPFRS